MRHSKPHRSTPLFMIRLGYLSLVIAVAFGLRVAGLNRLPLSLSLDEAVNGIDALRLFRAGWLTPFLQNNFGRETLFFYVQSLALQLYGISIFSLRFVSALTGTLSIPLLYLVGESLQLENLIPFKSLSLKIASLLAAAGLAVSYWHIYFSRIGLRAILLPPLLLGSIWCFWQGWLSSPGASGSSARRGRIWLGAAGFLVGLTFYTYLAARLLPFLFGAFALTELLIRRSDRRQQIVSLLIFGSICALVAIPLAVYFLENPHAFNSRAQNISILAGEAPLDAFVSNSLALLRMFFVGGTWLGQWPALSIPWAPGLLAGILACLYRVRERTSRFLLLWWAIGTIPTLITSHDWGATTTIQRSIVAWPATFLLSAIGLATMLRLGFNWLAKPGKRQDQSSSAGVHQSWLLAPLCLLLLFDSLVSGYNYFVVWARPHILKTDANPLYLARFLNEQDRRISLIPLGLFKENVTSFLLQSHYPNLSTPDLDSMRALLASNRETSLEHVPAIYIQPDWLPLESALVLLAPAVNEPGQAYLLPPITEPQFKALSSYFKTTPPISKIRNGKQEPIAQVYPLFAEAPVLPEEPPLMQPIQANFDNDILINGYRVDPATARPGQAVTLYLSWQVLRFVDGDYYQFLHLFDIAQMERRGQVNLPLSNIAQNPYRWSGPLTYIEAHRFGLPPEGPEGVYLFELGLYHNFSLERLPVIIGEAEQPPDDQVILGKFRVQLHPPSPPEYPIGAQFARDLLLVGGDFPERALAPGGTLTYTLQWRALDSVDKAYTVFNHLLDSEGNMRAQQDGIPQGGRYPTTMWDPGEIVPDTHSIPLPSDLEPGQYTLRVGLYEAETGGRLPLLNQAGDFVELPGLFHLEAVR